MLIECHYRKRERKKNRSWHNSGCGVEGIPGHTVGLLALGYTKGFSLPQILRWAFMWCDVTRCHHRTMRALSQPSAKANHWRPQRSGKPRPARDLCFGSSPEPGVAKAHRYDVKPHQGTKKKKNITHTHIYIYTCICTLVHIYVHTHMFTLVVKTSSTNNPNQILTPSRWLWALLSDENLGLISQTSLQYFSHLQGLSCRKNLSLAKVNTWS